MRTIYADEVFIFNAAVDSILLIAAGNLCGLPFRRIRVLAGGGIGGVYAVAVQVFEGTPVSWTAVKVLVGVLIPLCAFGYLSRSAFLRRLTAFWIMSVLAGGAVLGAAALFGGSVGDGYAALHPAGLTVVAFSLGLMLLASSWLGGAAIHAAEERVRVRVSYGGREAEFTALVDSGNTLRDPVSGLPVIVAELEAVSTLFRQDVAGALRKSGGDAATFLASLSGKAEGSRFRLVPCVTVSGKGMLPAFRPDRVELGGKETHALIAVSDAQVGQGGTFAALVGRLT